jgi:hypothetical protein
MSIQDTSSAAITLRRSRHKETLLSLFPQTEFVELPEMLFYSDVLNTLLQGGLGQFYITKEAFLMISQQKAILFVSETLLKNMLFHTSMYET